MGPRLQVGLSQDEVARVGPHPGTGVPTRRPCEDPETHKGGGHMKTEAEVDGRGCGTLGAPRSCKRRERPSPRASEGTLRTRQAQTPLPVQDPFDPTPVPLVHLHGPRCRPHRCSGRSSGTLRQACTHAPCPPRKCKHGPLSQVASRTPKHGSRHVCGTLRGSCWFCPDCPHLGLQSAYSLTWPKACS